jgi:hypothetical protein
MRTAENVSLNFLLRVKYPVIEVSTAAGAGESRRNARCVETGLEHRKYRRKRT